ncbi:MAG: hypothetical protein Q9218_005346 [Villophora microphyllina]
MASPLDMASRHDLEDTFNAMRPHFEDKETEQNWQLREKDTAKLRRITLGNAPKELKETYQTGIKSLLEGIIKVVNSLRTTLSAGGCDLIQDMAREKTPGMDNMAEIVLPHLVKLCASTKKIAATKADATVNIVIACISYNIFLMKLIWAACEDKNVQPRKAATGWLKTLVAKHRDNKAVFEKGEGLPLFEKCLKKGLSDGNPDVRKSMRPTYWAFIRLWPERSENILSTLSEQHRKVLITETAETDSVPAPVKAATIAAAKSTATKPKTSIKDAIAAKRQAAKTDEPVDITDTKITAHTTVSNIANATHQSAHHVHTAPGPIRQNAFSKSTSTVPNNTQQLDAPTKTGTAPTRPSASTSAGAHTTRTLSSAPVRPSRMMRKATNPTKEASAESSKSAPQPVSASPPEATNPAKEPSADFPMDDSQGQPVTAGPPQATITPTRSRSNSFTDTVKAFITDTVRALTPEWSRPTSAGKEVDDTHPATPSTRTRANSITEAVKVLNPDFSKSAPAPQSSPKQAKAPKPADEKSLFTPSIPSATSAQPVSKASEVPSCTSFDRPMKPIFSRKEAIARKALAELPINEPRSSHLRSASSSKARSLSKLKHYEDEKIRLTREKWTYVENYQMAHSKPACRDPINALRKTLRARMVRIKGCKGDLQDFRDIQSIIRGSHELLENEPGLFDELLFTIFELMDSDRSMIFEIHAEGDDHNTQLLVTLRLLLQQHKSLFSTYFPRALCSILAASRNIDDDTHMAIALEDTVLDLVEQCDAGNLEDSIDGVLDYLESCDFSLYLQPLHLGLYTLGQLMRLSDPGRLCRPLVQEERLGGLGARGLGSSSPEVRHAACHFAVQYRGFLQDEDRFWEYISPVGTDRMRVVGYFLAKAEQVEQIRVEGELLERSFSGLAA